MRIVIKFLLFSMISYLAYIWGIAPRLEEITNQRSGCDFDDFYFAAKSSLVHGNPLFDHQKMQEVAMNNQSHCRLPIYYQPPLSTITFAPLLLFSLLDSHYIWLVCSLICLFFLVMVTLKHTNCATLPELSLMITLLLTAFFKPLHDHLWQGQTNLFCSALTLGGVALTLNKKRPILGLLGALLMAFSIHNKPFMAIIFVYLISTSQWLVAVQTGMFLVLLTLCSLAIFSWQDYWMYPKHVAESMYFLQANASSLGNFSIKTAIEREFFSGQKTLYSQLLGLGIFALYFASCIRVRKKNYDPRYLFLRAAQSLLLIGAFMGSIWRHHVVLYIPALILASLNWIELISTKRRIAIGYGVVLLFTFTSFCFLPNEPNAQVIATLALLLLVMPTT